MVSDVPLIAALVAWVGVSIRFEVRGGFRHYRCTAWGQLAEFQSALRFAVVSDFLIVASKDDGPLVSIRFEVRGGFRRAS